MFMTVNKKWRKGSILFKGYVKIHLQAHTIYTMYIRHVRDKSLMIGIRVWKFQKEYALLEWGKNQFTQNALKYKV